MVEKIKRYRHIRYDRKYEGLYKKIGKEFGDQDGLTTKIYLTALTIGFLENKYEPLTSNTKDIRYFDELPDDAKWLIKCIAIAHTEDIFVLERGNEMLDICDAYANGGIRVLEAILFSPSMSGTPIKKFERYVREKLHPIINGVKTPIAAQ